MVRLFLAVLGGYLVFVILTVVKFAVVLELIGNRRAPGATPPLGTGVVGAILLTDILSAIVAGYAAAWLGHGHGIRPAVLLGVMMVILSFVHVAGGPGQEPLWYQIGLVLSAFPAAWLGGRLRLGRGGPTAEA